MARRATLAAFGFAAVPFVLMAAGWDAPQQKASFSGDVLPLLKANCASCHSGDSPSGGLNLVTFDGLRKGGESGAAFEAGKSKTSLIMQRIRGEGGLPRMPMGFAPLSKEKVAAIAAWIDAGAKPDAGPGAHWSYVRPSRPAVPKLANSSWIRNPIDAFVLEKLREEGLVPSAEASKETLLRRVSLDLIGLPPSPKEVDAFLADTRPGAYERAVDRLLASPHYGERQARMWLDLARYADSDGYEKDLNRTAWKYRDWVIAAFNRNMPYNQFTIEQLAGDLLPNPTIEQMVATGFNRNTMFNREGGVDQEEAHFNVVLDRVSTTSTVFLGTTMGCARCHDHKYDPFSQKDHYKMAAFYSNAVVLPRGPKEVGEEKWFESEIEAGSPEQFAKRASLRIKLAVLQKEYSADTPELAQSFERWKAAQPQTSWTALNVESAVSTGGAKLERQSDGSLLATGANPDKDTYTIQGQFDLRGVTGFRLETLPDPSLVNKGPGRSDNGNYVLNSLILKVNGRPVALSNPVADYSQPDFNVRGAVDADPNSGWAVNMGAGKPHELVAEIPPQSATGLSKVEVVLEQQSIYRQHTIGRLRLSFTHSPSPTLGVLPSDIRDLMSKPARTAAEEKRVLEHFRTASAELRPVREKIAATQADLQKLQAQIPTALVMMDKPTDKPLAAYMRTRGEFLSKAEVVTAGTPAILPPLRAAKPNRLSLARWLVSKENPLTARVQINRMWEQYFGRGIVETSEDFGTQGARPSHPKLLDWLATEFMRNGWNMKAIHRLIVTSSTYRQSSALTPVLLRKDPLNTLLARGPRFRMEAEMIRDNALAAAGLLNPKIGGPSVYPFQPEGVWDNPFSNERWVTSSNGDQYRRGLYTFLKRTAPYASFMTFDSTSREACTVRRSRTNTPLQALAMLNDGALFDAAKALGSRMSREGGESTPSRLDYGFRLAMGRHATKPELARMKKLFGTLKARYSKEAAARAKLGGSAEQAAWTMVANVLLNLDETVTKG